MTHIIKPKTRIKKYAPKACNIDNLFRLATPQQRELLKTLKTEQARHLLISQLKALGTIVDVLNQTNEYK